MAAQLEEVGYETDYVESGAPGRGNVFARLAGADPARGALLLHGHLDVVPAEAADWSVHPFSGAVEDGYVWGRGAVDMKDMVGMMIAVARHFKRTGIVPPRDLVFAFLADEEAGGKYGSQWLVDNRPDLFDGVTEAVGEVGGFSLTVPRRDGGERRLYMVETAEKGMGWLRLTARGGAGHGSFLHEDNAVTALAGRRRSWVPSVPARHHRFGRAVPGCCRGGDRLDFDVDPRTWTGALAKLGLDRPDRRRDPARHGKPDHAEGRLQGQRDPRDRGCGGRLPGAARPARGIRTRGGRNDRPERHPGMDRRPAVVRNHLRRRICVDAMNAAILAADPDARTVPYMLSGGTDAKAFARLGIRCFGFAPLRLPPDLDFAALFHGVDERVPVDALTFGTHVLEHFLMHC